MDFLTGALSEGIKQEDERRKSRLALMLKKQEIQAQMESDVQQKKDIYANELASPEATAAAGEAFGIDYKPGQRADVKEWAQFGGLAKAKLAANKPEKGVVPVEVANHAIEGTYGITPNSPFQKEDYPNGVPFTVVKELQTTMKAASGSASDKSRYMSAHESNKGTDELAHKYEILQRAGAVGVVSG
jgi:hypothetical protein